ncbi:MAG: polysaccharide deacetylase family protein [Candidatus Aureabacteria bacterium]|nr:polysaccharide deacetylase family protein [Candidatus Auribacterota bacterium]
MKNGTKKIACFTLDLEADYAGMPSKESFDSLDRTEKFEEMVTKYGLKLTTFVTGAILDRHHPVLDRLKALGSRFETHTYSHPLKKPPREKIADIERGIEAYEHYFGERPTGYRAPQGIISMDEIRFLSEQGLLYSSSIFPAYLPGRYNNLRFPTQPFIYRETGLLEIPLSVIPWIRFPVTASHVNLFSSTLYMLLMRVLGCPRLLNICMHLYDFCAVPAYHMLPLKEKIGYSRTHRRGNKFSDFEILVRYLISNGYQFAYLGETAHSIMHSGQATSWGNSKRISP